MKRFENVSLDPAPCRRELDEFNDFLEARQDLAERAEIQPFFKSRPQLTAFLGTYMPDIGPATQLAYEFPIGGDFAADIVVGNKDRGAYCFVELEDAQEDSIFKTVKGKATKEWGSRFEHGFSQLLDWFFALDDLKATHKFAEHFGYGHIKFDGLLVIGRSARLVPSEITRLKWRTDRVQVNTHGIHCLTFDDLHKTLTWRLSHYPQASKLG